MLRFWLDKVKNKYGYANLFFYAAALTFAAAVKLYYRSVENVPADPLLMLFLKPLSVAVGLFFGIPFEFDAAKGFFDSGSGIVIGPGCAGINFFVIVLCMLVFSFTGVFRTTVQKAASFAAGIIASYMIALLANTSRILASIILLKADTLPAGPDAATVHQFTGILFYLVYLICGFYIVKAILPKVRSNL